VRGQIRDFNARNYPTLNALLDTLTPKASRLNYGARVLVSAGGKTRITQLNQIDLNKKSVVGQLIEFPKAQLRHD
jgi:hypothetical protein